ncbi:hypothetical protein UFOVP434_14 [uncultured Caudovirales phage]|uniref:Uncharacterized protein n=1 Tax=uncultured Caudovirales phage TaxID=2100421 RepID=A0A6J5M9U1_9CAUD|nr:hypothetical protein UFOVP434_14 [uncultured Caudovirales phage]
MNNTNLKKGPSCAAAPDLAGVRKIFYAGSLIVAPTPSTLVIGRGKGVV